MKQIPKKLNTWTKTKKMGEDYLVLWESVVEIKQKQDEIIDYLSDKEEASKGENKGDNITLDELKESTRGWGECACLCHKNINNVTECEHCIPPQQEESRGECICAWWEHQDSNISTESVIPMPGCPIHTEEGRKKAKKLKPQLKEESPKEEYTDLERQLFGGGGGKPKEDEWEKDFDNLNYYHRPYADSLIKDYIKANFVSKAKLSKYVQDGIDECNEPGKHIGGVAVLREMQMALGLEEL